MGCGMRSPKRELLRVVSTTSGVAVDRLGRAPGRGGYLHRNPACWEQFLQRKGVVRSLARIVQKPAREQVLAQLRLLADA